MEAIGIRELAQRLGGEASAEAMITAASIDSRRTRDGDLFVALAGSRADGHDYIAAARRAGAAAALVSRPVADPLPQWRVKDPAATLRALGALSRERAAARVIGVTGSNGKTTVKRLLAAILGRVGETLASEGNYNNELGVPLTLCRLDARHRFAVVEMGAAAAGDIATLAAWARPQVGLVTNASAAHLQGFGSVEGVARAKGELFEGLPQDGIGVVDAASPYRRIWAAQLGARRSLSFGADETAADVTVVSAGSGCIRIAYRGEARLAEFALPGAHNRRNAAAAAAAAAALGLDLETAAGGFADSEPEPGRLAPRPGLRDARILDDSYNANPASLLAGLEVLAQSPGEHWLVLGDMAELGDNAERLHVEAGEAARRLGIVRVFAVGELAAAAARAFGDGGEGFASREALTEALTSRLHAGVTVLVKGSRSAGLEAVVRGLVAGEPPPAGGGGR